MMYIFFEFFLSAGDYPKVCVNLQTDVRSNYSVWRFYYGKKNENPQKAAMREMMRSYLKDNDISIKNGTDVNAVMRDMMSVILEDVLSFSMVFCVLLLMLSLFVPSSLKSLFFHFSVPA